MITGLVLQARNSSTRYPKKMLHKFMGKPAIEWVVERCQKANVDYRILATSIDKDDDILAEIAESRDWKVVRGSVEDVLSRYAKAVREFNLNTVVRITGDCLLSDYRIINYALEKFYEYEVDCLGVSNIIDGFDVSIFSGEAILEADRKAFLPSEREHIAPQYLWKSGRFKSLAVPFGDENLSHIHLSLDYKEDAVAIGLILERFNDKDFSYKDVVNLIKSEPLILDSARHIIPNEGYRKSLMEDEEFLKSSKRDAL